MNSAPHDPSIDDRLSAWLDGELTAAQRDEVEQHLREHPEDAARVRLWAADRDALRARFEPVLEEPPPTRLAQVVWSQASARVGLGWQRAAAAMAVFAIGAVVGGGVMTRWGGAVLGPSSPQASAGWVQRAAVAHAVYTPELRHPVEVTVAGQTADQNRAQEEHLARWLTRRLDVPVKLFDLRPHGYALVGGRLLPDAAGPSAQLMYERIGPDAAASASAAGRSAGRITVYLRKPEPGTPTAFRYQQHGGLGMFYWVEGEAGYAIVGALPRNELLTLADAIYRQEP